MKIYKTSKEVAYLLSNRSAISIADKFNIFIFLSAFISFIASCVFS